MYNSVKEWLNVPLTIKPFKKHTGAGDKVFGSARSIPCYPVGEVKLVRNKLGVDVASNCHFYIDGTQSIDVLDVLVFNGTEMPILTITTFYRDGVPDIKVVYT